MMTMYTLAISILLHVGVMGIAGAYGLLSLAELMRKEARNPKTSGFLLIAYVLLFLSATVSLSFFVTVIVPVLISCEG